MGKYEIKFNKQDGWSYGKEKIPVESDYVELSDDEVQILINLMKEKETYDVSELNIEELHPEIYNKLVDTCDSVAWDVAIVKAARDAHYYDEDHTFLDKLQEYCENNDYTMSQIIRKAVKEYLNNNNLLNSSNLLNVEVDLAKNLGKYEIIVSEYYKNIYGLKEGEIVEGIVRNREKNGFQ